MGVKQNFCNSCMLLNILFFNFRITCERSLSSSESNWSGRVQFGHKSDCRHRKRSRRPTAFPYDVNNAVFFFLAYCQLYLIRVQCVTIRGLTDETESTKPQHVPLMGCCGEIMKSDPCDYFYIKCLFCRDRGVSCSSFLVNTGLFVYTRQQVYQAHTFLSNIER